MGAQVLVYTRPLCLFCHQVLDLLRQSNIVHQQIEVTNREQQEQLIERYNARAFPIVLVDSVYLGGYAHILQLYSTDRLVAASGAAVVTATGPPRNPAPSLPSPPPGRSTTRRLSLMGEMGKLHKVLSDPEKPKPE